MILFSNLSIGTSAFIHSNPEFVENQELQNVITCNKDTGGMKTLQAWSRGMFFIVGAGEHIEYWQPLYR